MEKQFSAGGVVIKEENGGIRVLLIKDSYGHWTWPKGHIERNESDRQAALREIREETGLADTSVMERVGEQEYYFTLKGKRIFKTVYIFLVKEKGNSKIEMDTSEIQDARWFLPEDALNTIEYKGSKEILKNGIEIFRKSKK